VHRLLAAGAALTLAAPAPAFRFTDPQIVEASGIGLGVRSPGIAYVQNDSGDTNRFFAVDVRTGATAATVTVAGATNVDWEDLAVGRTAAGVPSVWLADTGDNGAARPEVRIYRVAEPQVAPDDRDRAISTAPAAVWRLRYPDGPTDAEGLAVGPGGTAYVVTKSVLGRSVVYRVPPNPDAEHVQLLHRVGAIALTPHGVPNPVGVPGELAITGAAISPDGSTFAVRTYAEAYLWRLGPGGVPAALRQRPRFVRLPRQPQGEGIALPDDRHAWVDSEGQGAAVYEVALPSPGANPAGSSVPASGPASGAPSRAFGRAPSGHPRWPLLLAGLAIAVGLGIGVWRFRPGARSTSDSTGR